MNIKIDDNGFLANLTIVFIILKLLGVIDWSWLLVLSPLLLGAVIMLVVFLLWRYKR